MKRLTDANHKLTEIEQLIATYDLEDDPDILNKLDDINTKIDSLKVDIAKIINK